MTNILNPRKIWIESQHNLSNKYEIASATLRRPSRKSGDVVSISKDGKSGIVCDGMNGMKNARLFALTAANVAMDKIENGESLINAIQEASKASINLADYVTKTNGGAAGLAIQLNDNNQLEWYGLGDITIWLFQPNGVTMLCEPHTKYGALTSYIGKDIHLEPLQKSHGTTTLNPDCIAAIMTDGLWKYCDIEVLINLFSQNDTLENKAVDAIKNGIKWMTPDDASILLIKTNQLVS